MAIGYMGDPFKIPVLIKTEEIVYLDRIIEGYGHLGFATSADGKKGLVYIQVTEDTKEEVMEILSNFPFELRILTEEEAEEIKNRP
ncbi:MAG: DUF4911 domain-containing protein [Clostridia bacterium]|nr:DUF4911 domain-containing protein [Clostridia bacterium]